MDEFENEFLGLRSDKPLVLFGYIDHVFFIWTHGEKELQKFIEDVNNSQPMIKFIFTSSKTCISFLDLDVHLSEGKFTTNLQTTDRHQYLHFMPSHSNYIKLSIV